ncbi:MAG: MFS transporter [Desulfurococcales archaeon]|nr:MFS transporter [Desulfurococcales archaeon]
MGSVWSKNVVSLTVYNAFRGFAVGGFMTLLPMYMKYLGYSMNSIGGVISVASILLSLILPFIGYLIDKYGSRLMVSATGLLLILAIIQAILARNLIALGLAYGLFLFSFLAGQPARMNFLASSVGIYRMGEAVGATSSVFSASRTIGPLAAGVIARLWGFRYAFTSLALAAVIGLAAFILLSEPVESASKPKSVKEAYRYLLKPPRNFAFVLGFVSLDRFAWSLWFPMLSAHLYASGFQEDEVGYIITLTGVVRTAILPFVGKLVDQLGAWLGLVVGEITGLITALLYSEPTGWLRVIVASIMMGVSIAVWIPSYNSLIAKVAGGTGGAYAAANTARSLLGSPAPVTGGYLYDAIAPSAPFIASSILLTAATLYSLFLLRRVEEALTV